MNKVIYTLLVTSILLSCGSQGEKDLEKLQEKREKLAAELKAINMEINELDTSNIKASSYVKVDTLKKGRFEHYFEVQGIVEAENNVILVAEMPAIIKKIHVTEGTKVEKGRLLVTLDNEAILRQIDEIQTKLDLANFIFEKQSNLRKDNIGSELDYKTALSNKNSLEDALKTAQTQLSKTQITAPFTGIVDDIFPREGELAGPQQPLIRFVSLGQSNIKVDVPESYLNKIKIGDEVEVQFPDLGITHVSKISQRGNFIEALNRTFKITVELPKDDKLLPNLIGVVKIRDFVLEDALLINQENIMQDGEGRNYVFKIDNSSGELIARKIFVEKGVSYLNTSYIIKGLSPNDLVVSKGARGIIDGETVHYGRK